MRVKTFHKGGIHPPEEKLTADSPLRELQVPEELYLPLSQCIGAPSKAVVKAGAIVVRGQMIAEAGGFVSAPIHSPVNGTVKKIEGIRNPQGLWQEAIILVPDAENPLADDTTPRTKEEIEVLSPQDIIKLVNLNGIVGLGGATFPTHVKLSIPEGKYADYILINGAECEPYLTCDDLLMQTEPEKILIGASLIMKATGAKRCIVGIEINKREAIKKMKDAASKFPSIEVQPLKKKYPQGSEKQLIYALTGRTVPAGCLPVDCHCVVDNVATAFAIYEAIYLQKPLMERIVTVTGKDLSGRGNFKVLNGTSLSFLLQNAGGLPENTGKVIAGGPMMGRAVSFPDSPATKGLSGLVVMPLSQSERKESEPCIRCSACVMACPMGLEPYLFMQQAERNYWEDMKGHGVLNCIECGCCSYSCPASRPLLDWIRYGKNMLRKMK